MDLQWTNEEFAGLLPQFLSREDPLPAVEQLDAAYSHGGGWRKFEGFTLTELDGALALEYAGDPPMREVSRTTLRGEVICLFRHSWVAVIQPNGGFEVARMD
jgi:hypothetical protein